MESANDPQIDSPPYDWPGDYPAGTPKTILIGWIVTGALGLLALGIIVAALATKESKESGEVGTEPSGGKSIGSAAATKADPDADLSLAYDKWTHRELVEHLRRKGLVLQIKNGERGTYLYRPSAIPADYQEHVRMYLDDILEPLADSKGWDGFVRVSLMRDHQGAREAVGTLEGGAFAWKRFTFYSENPAFLRGIRSRLP